MRPCFFTDCRTDIDWHARHEIRVALGQRANGFDGTNAKE